MEQYKILPYITSLKPIRSSGIFVILFKHFIYQQIMKKILIPFLTILTVFFSFHFVAFSQPGESVDLSKPRIWTAVTGHRLKAAYEGRDGNKIHLLVHGGKVKTILFEKLSEADRILLNEAVPENGGGKADNSIAGNNGNHPYIQFLADAKQKRLGGEDGVKYYQSVIDELYLQALNYEFKYPKDFIAEDGTLNKKYLKGVHVKKIKISERKNLFTGEQIPTPGYKNEPRWEMVDQKMKFTVDGPVITLKQQDTLYSGSKEEKIVEFGISINKMRKNAGGYEAWYREDSKEYFYHLDTCVNPDSDGGFTIGRAEKTKWLTFCCLDLRKGIFYSLNILIDNNGKITIQNSDEGSFRFYATTPKTTCFCLPRVDNRLVFTSVYVKAYALGFYDMNGSPIDLEKLWSTSKAQDSHYRNNKPSNKHDDPLNIFAERNIRDK